MSFFSNFQSDKCPGPITGSPSNGLNEKVCIHAEKVFDACIKQSQLQNYTLTITDITPKDVTFPLTFVSARSSSSQGTLTNLNTERTSEKGCSRVSCTVGVPVQVVFTDANGREGTANATISVSADVLMYVPAPSILPYNVTAIVSAVAPEATQSTATAEQLTFVVNACATIILKVSMPVELLVPSYGYCAIPPAQEYSQEVCAGFFELPLYPRGNDCECNDRGGGCGGNGNGCNCNR